MGDPSEPNSPTTSPQPGDDSDAAAEPAADADAGRGEEPRAQAQSTGSDRTASEEQSGVNYNVLTAIEPSEVCLETGSDSWQNDVEASLAELVNGHDPETPLDRMIVHAQLLADLRYVRNRSRYENFEEAVADTVGETIEAASRTSRLAEAFGTLEECRRVVEVLAVAWREGDSTPAGSTDDATAIERWGRRSF